MTDYKQGDIWLAKVYFVQSGKFKRRPVLVVGNERVIDIDVLSAPVTSQDARNEFDLVISNWKEVGLSYPSVVRVSKLSAIPKDQFISKLGSLSSKDLDIILKKCRELF
jgi:mRNA interferase MazF